MAFINFTNSPSNGATLTANGVTFTYNTSKARWEAGSAGSLLTTEQVQDITGAMFTGNTETGVTATYEDSDGTIDLVAALGTDWDTTLKTSAFTGVSGKGYLLNTTSAAITVTLPASPSAGDTISISDARGTAHTNAITIARNGSNIYGAASNISISTKRGNISLIYTDSTNGWVATDSFALEKGYTLTGSAANVNEGVTLTVSLATVNVSNGTQVPYTITGVTSADLGGVSLTGNFTINSSAATATFTPAEDTATEGSETMVLTLDGTSVALSTTINDTSVASPAMQGMSSGYSAGGLTYPSPGISNVIDKYSFTSDGNATDVGDLTNTAYLSAGGASGTHGYHVGGKNPSDVWWNTDKFAFASDGNAVSVPSAPAYQLSSIGVQDSNALFSMGGHRAPNPSSSQIPGNSAVSQNITKILFASDTFSDTGVDMNTPAPSSQRGAGNASSTHGYHAGSLPASNIISKFSFAATSGSSSDVGDLVATQHSMGSNSSETTGYIVGGEVDTNVIQSFPFASDGNATDIANLSVGRGNIQGSSSSTTKGYTAGGNSADVIDSFPFATASDNATDVGNLTVGRRLGAKGNIQV